MKVLASVHIALQSLGANKLRSGLTMLGIIIGVMSVIAMLSIGQGAQAQVTKQIESIGTNLLFIRPGAIQQNGVASAGGTAATLTLQDAQALQGLPGIIGVLPETFSEGQLAFLGSNVNGRVLGVTDSYPTVMNATVADGSFFTNAQMQADESVVVLGSQIAQDLFNGAEPVGQEVRINNEPFLAVGVMQPTGGTGFLNGDTTDEDQYLVVRSTDGGQTFDGPFRVCCFSADEVARRILGRPIMNTALLGGFAALTGELSLEAVVKAVRSRFPGQLGEKNALVVEESYQQLSRALT